MKCFLSLPDSRGRGYVLVDPHAIVFIEPIDDGQACNLRLSCGLFVCVDLPMERMLNILGVYGIAVDNHADLAAGLEARTEDES